MPLEPPPSPDELERAVSRLGPARKEARRRRRRRQVLLGAAGVLLVAAAIGLPLGLTAGAGNGNGHLNVTSPPPHQTTTTTTPPTSAPPVSAPPTTASPPTTAPPTTAPPPPTTSPTGGSCPAGQLSASLLHTGAAAGSAIDTIGLTNAGSTTCTLDGYPGLTLSDAQGQAVPATVGQGPVGGVAGPAPITLAPGSSASFFVQFSAGTGIPGASCQPSNIEITPPGTGGQVRLGTTVNVCASPGTPAQLLVSALVAGTSP